MAHQQSVSADRDRSIAHSLGRTNCDLTFAPSHFYGEFTLPAGTQVTLIRGAIGGVGDMWAVRDAKLLKELTGNTHDPIYRYTWVPDDAVEV